MKIIMNKERKAKINALVRLINDYLDLLENLNEEAKLEAIRKLISTLLNWY